MQFMIIKEKFTSVIFMNIENIGIEMTAPKEVSSFWIKFFFVIGLISSLAFRLILIANNYWPEAVRWIWYCGVIGYVAFFMYRTKISFKRRRTVTGLNLIEKLENGNLDSNDKDAIKYILNSLVHSKEVLNYIIIFVLSGIAIFIDIIMEVSR